MSIVTLSNGVRVLVQSTPHTQSVAVGAFVRVGSRNETKQLNGISHFLEHMAFKGTATRDYRKISQDVERLGADMNAFTDKNMTAYYVSGLASHLPVFVDLIGDIFCNSVFPADEIERERGVILQEYKQYADDPGSVAGNMYDEVCFPGQSVGRKILGEPKNIKSFTRDDFVKYTQDFYIGANVIVGIAGNVDEEEAVKLAERHFGHLPRGTMSSSPSPVYHGGVATKRKATQQVTTYLGFNAMPSTDPAHYATVVALSAFGSGMSSPLFDEIREKRGLAYAVGGSADITDVSGTVAIFGGTTAEHLSEYFDVTCNLLKSHAQSVAEVDLERAKNSICVRMTRASERPFSMIQSQIYDLFGGKEKLLTVKEEMDIIQSITPKQVTSAFEQMLTTKPTLVIVGKGADDKYYEQILSHFK